MTRQMEADVVVLGGGMAGLCASQTALEHGASVITVEKGTRFGGSMRLSGGLIWTFKDKSQLRELVPDGNPLLQDIVVDGLHDGLDWLERLGVPLGPWRKFMWYGEGRAADPRELTARLVERIQASGGVLRLRTSLESLLVEDGQVVGVRLADASGISEVRAGSVILCTGGFQGNGELLARYVTPYPDKVYLRANPWSTGDGLLAAMQVGAATTPSMSAVYGHALAAPPTRFAAREFLEVTQRYGPIAVAINLDGQRFTDESAGTGEEHLNLCIARQRDATAVYVLDAETSNISYQGAEPPRVVIERLRTRNAPVLEANSLEELCRALAQWGLPAERTLQTLSQYNAAITGADTEQLWPPRRENRFPLSKPPYIAVAVRAGITFTCGGLQVDAEMRVQRRTVSSSMLPLTVADPSEIQAHPIPNLYAAGCDVGGVSGEGYLGGLATALVTARIAGKVATE